MTAPGREQAEALFHVCASAIDKDGIVDGQEMLVAVHEIEKALAQAKAEGMEEAAKYPAIHLIRYGTSGEIVVSVGIDGKWIPVIRERGEVVSHIVEGSAIAQAIRQAGEK